MDGYYDYRLVALSIMISILGAYASRELAHRMRSSKGRSWLTWLICGATADGIGTWSMHHTAMMAFSLPIPVLYHWPSVLLSLLVGIVGSAGTFLFLRSSKIGWRPVVAGVVLGSIGISGLHYTAMTSMRLQGTQHHSHALTTLAVFLAIVISVLALSIRDYSRTLWLQYHCAAWIRGAANPVMHYTAMAGTTFTYVTVSPDMSQAVPISFVGVVVPVMLFFAVLLTSLLDRNSKQKALLNELFEQAPQAVALLDSDNRVLRVNREFTHLFGYSAQESQGRPLTELIIPDEPAEEQREFSELVPQGKRVEGERVRKRKDGSTLIASIVGVPVLLPGGDVATYGIYRDITEQKRAEEALSRAQSRIESILSSVADIHILFDRDWRFLYVNEAALRSIGRTREEILGRTLAELYPDLVGTEFDRQCHRAMEERRYLAFEFHYVTDNTWWENRFYPVSEGLSVFATNISERKLAEAKLRATTEQLRALSARVQAAKEEEAARIAREIHDELGAALTSLRWSLEDIDEAVSDANRSRLEEVRKKIAGMITLTDTTVNTVRRIASELRPVALDELGLSEAIEWQARQFQERTGIEVQCDCNLEGVNLTQEESTAIFRIYQEALTNILRHAHATQVNVDTRVERAELIVSISDNGRGITDDEKSGQRSLGLLGMRERAHLVGGRVEIVGSKGGGTVVTVRIPAKRVRNSASG